MADNTTAAVSPEEVPQMGFFDRLTGVFFEPTKTFADINRKATWLGIFLIMAVLTMAVAYTTSIRTDPELTMRQALDASPIKLSEEQKEQALQAQLARQQNPIYRYGSLLAAPIMNLIFYLIMAGIFLLLFVLMGAPLNFKKSLSVTIWALAPPAIIATILTIILLFVKDPNSIDLMQGVVMSNLGWLIDRKAHPVLASLLASIDLFSIWSIALLAIGFAAISDKKLTVKKAATGVIILWVIYVLGKMGYRAIFG